MDCCCSFTRSTETGLALTIAFLCFHSLKGFFGGGKSIHRRRLGGCALSPRWWCRSSSNYRGWQVEARRQKHALLATTRFAAPSLRQPQHEEPSTKKPKAIEISLSSPISSCNFAQIVVCFDNSRPRVNAKTEYCWRVRVNGDFWKPDRAQAS